MPGQRNKIIFSALATALLLATQSPSAQTIAVVAPTAAKAPAASTNGTTAGRLSEAYAASVGSTDDARAVVEGMRAGKDVTVAGTTVAGTGKTMGFGNIDVAMSLAKSQVGPNATSAEFLGALNGVMGQRASGLGWGEIAKSMGVTVGQVMGASKEAKSADTARSGKAGGSSASGNAGGNAGGKNGGNGNAGGNGNGGGSGGGGNGGGNGGGGGKK